MRKSNTLTPKDFTLFCHIMDKISSLMYRHLLIQYYMNLNNHMSKETSYPLVSPDPNADPLNCNRLVVLTGLRKSKCSQLLQAYRERKPELIHYRYKLAFTKDLCLLLVKAQQLALETLPKDKAPSTENALDLRKVMPTQEEQNGDFLAFLELISSF